MNDDDKIHLPGGLSFYRFKRWGDDEYIMEANEPAAYLSDEFKEKNPGVKVAFMNIDEVEFDEDGVVGSPINVELY